MVWLRLAANAASGVAILTGSPYWHAIALALRVAVGKGALKREGLFAPPVMLW